MPTYEYVCPEGHQFELFQRISDKPEATCPTCGEPAVRKISGGAGLVFKGSGFYITDYGKDGKGPRKAPAETGGASTSPGSSSGSAESKPAAKPAEAAAPKSTPKAAE
ncbi:MAG TPA: zinc ribbon domain-containing protein [Gemmatimonadales bacterium]|nr:zinc ribbon domain-containing protein [Gemmatimonadales bacterium]